VKLLSSKHLEIAEQAIWALGNVAGDCAIYRDMILKSKGLHPLIKLIEEAKKKETIKHGIWTLSNLCRGRPLPKFDLVKDSIPVFAQVLKTSTESEVLTDAAWAMSYLSDGDNDRIDLVIQTGVIPKLIELLNHPYISILIPCLRSLGNIVTGEDRQTNEVLKAGAL
jgi:importin subunit alpha-1